jgi:hypothetical protein
MLGIFNSPLGQIIGPHLSAKKLARMVEEYMGFEQFEFIQDNVAVFEQAETQKLAQEVQQQGQEEQQEPLEAGLLEAGMAEAGLQEEQVEDSDIPIQQ